MAGDGSTNRRPLLTRDRDAACAVEVSGQAGLGLCRVNHSNTCRNWALASRLLADPAYLAAARTRSRPQHASAPNLHARDKQGAGVSSWPRYARVVSPVRQVDGLRRWVATFGCDLRTTFEVRRPSNARPAAAAAPAVAATGTAGGSSASAGTPDADTAINAERHRSRRCAVERGRMPMRLQSTRGRSKSHG